MACRLTRYFTVLCRSCVLAWLILSCLDAKYTPRDPTFVVPAVRSG